MVSNKMWRPYVHLFFARPLGRLYRYVSHFVEDPSDPEPNTESSQKKNK